MKITEEMLKEKGACKKGMRWFLENGLDKVEHPQAIAQLAKHNVNWAIWAVREFELKDITELYDDKNLLVHKLEYDIRGNILWEYEWKYDEKGNPLQKLKYDKKGYPLRKLEYDEKGNIVRRSEWKWEHSKHITVESEDYPDKNGECLFCKKKWWKFWIKENKEMTQQLDKNKSNK